MSMFGDDRDNLKLVSDLAIGRFRPLTVGLEGSADRARAELVSANSLELLRGQTDPGALHPA